MLKHLTVDEMVGLTAPWVDDAKRKALFLAIPDITSLHPKIIRAHAELLEAHLAGAVSPAMQKIIDDATAEDARHDTLARAISCGIEAERTYGLATDPPDRERVKLAEDVHSKLFPHGLNIINVSLLAESGNAARVAKLLEEEPAVGAFLNDIPVRGHGTLLAMTQRWIAAGTALGALERRRAEQAAKEVTMAAGKAAMNARRGRWMRLVSQVLDNLNLSEADAEAIETIRGPVHRASDRAARRHIEENPGAPSSPADIEPGPATD